MSEIIRHEVDDELAYSGFVEAGEYRHFMESCSMKHRPSIIEHAESLLDTPPIHFL